MTSWKITSPVFNEGGASDVATFFFFCRFEKRVPRGIQINNSNTAC